MSVSLLRNLQWRRAVKGFKGGKVDLKPILEAVQLAPSSMGVQPYFVHVVSCADARSKLKKATFEQPQVQECEHLLVFSARDDASNSVEDCCRLLELPDVAATPMREILSPLDKTTFQSFAANQAHIALGFALAAAADTKTPCCPMGGFDPTLLKKELSLPENETPVVIMAVGGGEQEEPPFEKLRLPLEHIVRPFP